MNIICKNLSSALIVVGVICSVAGASDNPSSSTPAQPKRTAAWLRPVPPHPIRPVPPRPGPHHYLTSVYFRADADSNWVRFPQSYTPGNRGQATMLAMRLRLLGYEVFIRN